MENRALYIEGCGWLLLTVCLILQAHSLNMTPESLLNQWLSPVLMVLSLVLSVRLHQVKGLKAPMRGRQWLWVPVFCLLVAWVAFSFFGKALLYDEAGLWLSGAHWPLFVIFCFPCAVYVLLTVDLFRLCTNRFAKAKSPHLHKKALNQHSLALFFVQAGLLGLYLIAYNPGSTGLDTYHQLAQQYHLLPYSNWHPLSSTLLMKGLLTLWDHFLILSLFQLLFFCLVSTAFYRSFLRRGAPLPLVYTMAIVLCLLPTNGVMLTTIVKDTQFTIALLWLTWLIYEMTDRSGKTITRGLLLSYFTGLSAVALLRFNGLLSLIFVAILFPFHRCKRGVPRENRLRLSGVGVATLIGVLLFNTLVPSLLQADNNPTGTKLRTIYNGYGAMYKAQVEDRLSLQERMAIEEVASPLQLKRYYDPYTADPYMRQVPDFIGHLSQMQTADALRIYLHALQVAPSVILGDKFNLSLLTWSVAPDQFSYNNAFTTNNIPPDPVLNHYDFSDHHIPRWKNPLTDFFDAILYPSINDSAITASLMWRAGFPLLLLLICLFHLWLKRSPKSWIYLPLLSNLLAVFLTMPAQEFRYVYGVVLLSPFLILASLLPSLQKTDASFTEATDSGYNEQVS